MGMKSGETKLETHRMLIGNQKRCNEEERNSLLSSSPHSPISPLTNGQIKRSER